LYDLWETISILKPWCVTAKNYLILRNEIAPLQKGTHLLICVMDPLDSSVCVFIITFSTTIVLTMRFETGAISALLLFESPPWKYQLLVLGAVKHE
jgi:hypothetical protein